MCVQIFRFKNASKKSLGIANNLKYCAEANFPERKENSQINMKFIYWLIGNSCFVWIFPVSLLQLWFESNEYYKQRFSLSLNNIWSKAVGIKENRSHRSPAICAGFSDGLKHVETSDCKLNVWQRVCLTSPTPFQLLTEAKLKQQKWLYSVEKVDQ